MKIRDNGYETVYEQLFPYFGDKDQLMKTQDLTRLIFIEFHEMNKDTFSLIDRYNRTSKLRARMDRGDSIALHSGDKQLLNDIDISDIPVREDDFAIDDGLLHWMADIYVRLNWQYQISTKEISEHIDAKTLASFERPLYDLSEEDVCKRLYKRFWTD